MKSFKMCFYEEKFEKGENDEKSFDGKTRNDDVTQRFLAVLD